MLVAAACTGSPLMLSPVIPSHLEATLGVLRAAGCEVVTAGRAAAPRGGGSGSRGVARSSSGRGELLSYYDGLPGEELRITPPRGTGARNRSRGVGVRMPDGAEAGFGGGDVLRSVDFTTEPHPGVPTVGLLPKNDLKKKRSGRTA